MKLDKDTVTFWTTLLTNIGVIGGLFFLGFELKQNADATRIEMIQANRVMRIEYFQERRDSPYIIPIQVKLSSGQDLTEEEQSRYISDIAMLWGIAYYEWIQRELELNDEFIQGDETSMRELLGRPQSIDAYNRSLRNIYPSGFNEYVDAWIDRIESER